MIRPGTETVGNSIERAKLDRDAEEMSTSEQQLRDHQDWKIDLRHLNSEDTTSFVYYVQILIQSSSSIIDEYPTI